MITRDDKLEIFENFVVDSRLKKNVAVESSGSFLISGSGVNDNFMMAKEEETRLVDYLHYLHMHERSIKSWLKLKLAEGFMKKKKVRKIKYQFVDEFFANVKSSIKRLEIPETSAEFYTKAIERAKEQGQVALLEILRDKKDGILSELKILSSGVEVYVSENDVVKFFKESNMGPKMLKLTWIKNYARIIPDDVIEKKKEFDEKEIFDNYVILHFDKNDESTSMTKAEKEKAKDPIIFGVAKNSRKLFYVADWIDEHCDLTLDKFLSVLEMEEARKISQESIEKAI